MYSMQRCRFCRVQKWARERDGRECIWGRVYTHIYTYIYISTKAAEREGRRRCFVSHIFAALYEMYIGVQSALDQLQRTSYNLEVAECPLFVSWNYVLFRSGVARTKIHSYSDLSSTG